MISLKVSNGSSYRVPLPDQSKRDELLALARVFIRYESGLPEPEQTPFTGAIQATVSAALKARSDSELAEAERKAASETLKDRDDAIHKTVRHIRNLLSVHLAQEPVRAQAWGFMVRQTGAQAGRILLPEAGPDTRHCLERYIETEEARPAAEQFSLPPLADLINLRDSRQQLWQDRHDAEQRRIQANEALAGHYHKLATDLRLALGHLMLARYGGQIDRGLMAWGFPVVNNSDSPAAPAEAPAEPTAA